MKTPPEQEEEEEQVDSESEELSASKKRPVRNVRRGISNLFIHLEEIRKTDKVRKRLIKK